eukprot:gnl/TRDRNA2_/TRDRNA2_73682_c0_seq1.p2 gnl/TRDRNA2_/TRDRNA2_73682_c0~~gnl/TRDRNA2_/TRDRNA2_73682_c0_seq1.p2  ORF type:complete len:111 (-),score=16.63 gnl/TRDRNA2_/TRDRNA2_73682_c0_seq1:86-418(-)
MVVGVQAVVTSAYGDGPGALPMPSSLSLGTGCSFTLVGDDRHGEAPPLEPHHGDVGVMRVEDDDGAFVVSGDGGSLLPGFIRGAAAKCPSGQIAPGSPEVTTMKPATHAT